MTGGADAGAVRFARYAYAPNALGHCGPPDARGLLEQAATGDSDGDLRHLASAFEGAWPYLQLIAAANRIADPLDERVVEAYWIGNRLLDAVPPRVLRAALTERFAARLGRDLSALTDTLPAGAAPHHAFHVFSVYPWVGLLRRVAIDEPLRVLDRCRISWGRVVTASADRAVVRTRPLTWDGASLALGPPAPASFVTANDGYGFVDDLRPGDVVSLHWNWVCERLTPRAAASLRHITARQLDVVNSTPPPTPVALLA